MNPEINLYIEKRYQRWLDYSSWHCTQAGIANEATDILNEVVVALLEKDEEKILKMYSITKNGYRELDFFVLRMIKLNIYSPTSPYQSKYKKMIKADVEINLLNIQEDEYDYEEDRPARILAQWNQVREIIETLNLSDKAKGIFHFRFFLEMPFSLWKGPETKKELYETYNKVVELIKQKINKRSLI